MVKFLVVSRIIYG